MTITYDLGSAKTSVPGVYSEVLVQDSLLNAGASPRNILIVGEAVEGAPASVRDLRQSYFSDFPSILAEYRSGPIVDAARQLFTRQPSPEFTGSVGRVYVAKTNQSTQAERDLSPSSYGKLKSVRYGEFGNQVSTRVVTQQSRVAPSREFFVYWSAVSRDVVFGVNGARSASVAFDVTDIPTTLSDLGAALAPVGGSYTGGGVRTFTPPTASLALAVNGLTVTITSTLSWLAQSPAVQVGEALVIPPGSVIAGGSSENVGVYRVTSVSASAIVASKVGSWNAGGTADVAMVAPVAVSSTAVTGDQQDYATSEFFLVRPLKVTASATPAVGAGAALEIAEDAGSSLLGGFLVPASSAVPMFSATSAAAGSLAASASGSSLSVSVSSGSFQFIPKAGDVVEIKPGTTLAGAGSANVGTYNVVSAGPQSLSLENSRGTPTVSVAATPIANNQSALVYYPGVASSSVAGKPQFSSAERRVRVEGQNVSSGESFSPTPAGGRHVLEISYYNPTATAATVTIDQTRTLFIDVVASPAIPQVRVPLNKYQNIAELVAFLNSLSGVSARAGLPTSGGEPTSSLDEVQALPVLSLTSAPSFVGAVLADFYDFSQLFVADSGLLAFEKGSMLFKRGLPDAEASASFLAGGEVGASSNADFQMALDQALKTPVRLVVPLVSRDARFDVEDGLTDENSTYTIESVNSAVSAHCSQGWEKKVKRKRTAMLSFHGSFEDSIAEAGRLGTHLASLCFEMVRTADAAGSQRWFAPWMFQVMRSAGRAQALLSTSILNKTVNANDVKHIGNLSLFSDTLSRDFDPENFAQLESAINAGLVAFGPVPNSGIRQLSADVTTRSRVNDPKAYYYEREQLVFASMEVLDTCESVLANRIGARTTDVSTAIVESDVNTVLQGFVQSGAVVDFQPARATDLGVGYKVRVIVKFAETLEFVDLTLEVAREIEA